MLEQVKVFRSSAAEHKLMELMERIAEFGDEVAVEFPKAFPDEPVDEYRHTELWHVLIGSTVPQDFRLTDSVAVIAWMEQKVKTLIDSFS